MAPENSSPIFGNENLSKIDEYIDLYVQVQDYAYGRSVEE